MKRLVQAALMLGAAASLTACLDTLGPQTGSYKSLPKGVSISETNTLLAEAQIVHIADGDTLTVLGPDKKTYKIRLQGIDAPEKKQAFGQACKESLMQMTDNQLAKVEAFKKDRYGRIVGKVRVKGKDLALEQIKAGCGWHYTAYEKEQSTRDQKTYAKAEAQARAAERGLWQDAKPIAPWDFRRQQRN
ncbi:MAG: thermonuclease family protein [Thiothrix sp.]|nr:MAG: thermonuclease family protein [Thiothrix sp.]